MPPQALILGRVVIETIVYLETKGGGAMRALAQTALPFKIEATDALLTANVGLALFGEFVHGLGCSLDGATDAQAWQGAWL